MKLSKAQQTLLKRVEGGEHIRRNETFVTNTWFSTDVNADPINARTVDILMDAGLVEKRTVGTNYHRLVELFATNPIDYSADSGDFDTASRITPDPAGDDVAADDGRPVDDFRSADHWMQGYLTNKAYIAAMSRIMVRASNETERKQQIATFKRAFWAIEDLEDSYRFAQGTAK